MQAIQDSSTLVPQSGTTPENAFSSEYLERTRRRPVVDASAAPENLARGALVSGPWAVEEAVRNRRRLFTVIRRGDSVEEGAPAALAAQDPRTAALAAAVLPASALPNHLELSERANACGHRLHDGRIYLAHVAPEVAAEAPDLVHHLHAARHLTANLDSLTLLVEALDPVTLEALGRALARRLQEEV